MFDGLFEALIFLGIAIGIAIFLIGFGISVFITENAIISKKPIKPEIRLEINDNQIDTLYVYKEPE